MSKLREQKDLEKNPIGLPQEVVQELIPELDAHVSSMFTLYHLYQKHHWMVEGPQFRDLHVYLEENYNQIHADLDNIAERITVLGGTPTSNPVNQVKLSYIEHEAEGVYPIRDCLARDQKAEAQLATKLRETISLARKHNDYGTVRLLEVTLLKAEDRAHHLDHYLAEDTLQKKEALAAAGS